MPGPILFKQERVGKNGILFNILKFRTMKVDRKAEATHDSSKDAERTTPVGKLLRRTKIDELPQLINVLFGDMSLVGEWDIIGTTREIPSVYAVCAT